MSLPFTLLILINFLWTAYLTFLFYRKIISKNSATPQNNSSHDFSEIQKNLDQLTSQTKNSVSNIGLVRFNPFDDMGGDQSFALALLDQHKSGVIITSLHTRENTRIFAKPVKNGEGQSISLSKDEKLAIVKAIKD
ncbi:hypothetical protein A2410_03580 [Candidatus Shapirobacteria bacterium RIFOXYC1_FULL_38_24]|uniref:DUF4446 domain-containing protein n=2 Tax=Candidatus Shapironibacteriota TaxID=1752721 RepID=A0A0G0JYD2_9BACT|nr:MAG: hypothetical protein US90_C0002G0010 [Candidatus Shapirobacteria bacterium GW2011_GWE2_38_30]OGL55202.1 MAG: hypothetical protein A2195_02405 [Candidatus Shapirobacteria bacterium RIFOXYA1_FULL_39_17]OGL56028.1 MAG: hypothetical protein A2410_03580 [Candidatus Shapirobacteria bacterium RIFOXYC1_FULL_38_24]OGL57499.1 MAG: hypothetical protein A2367_02175 [Candidatus Shapirobacteria bacterium RIFOXYB1_FULL_38_38]HAP37815.1 hypothetical protein [Candidatus Shapirobacteria bacterium]